MKEYIEREWLVNDALAVLDFRKKHYMDKARIADAASTVEWLKYYAPAADVVERKRGEWVDVVFDPVWKKMKATCTSCSHRGEIRVKSNYCGFVVPDSDFCPNCGADMRGENNG